VQEHNAQGSANIDCPVLAGNTKPSVPQISYAAKNHTAENPNKMCGQQRGPKNSCSRESKEVTAETTSTKTAAPTTVSMEKRIKGSAVAKKSKKVVVLPTVTSSRPPKRNKGKNTSLNEDALVPSSDVGSDQSHYSQSESTYRYSDGSTELEASEEEGQATKKIMTDMLEQPIDNEQVVRKVENII
jgi:hypothetical protein